MSTEFQFSKMKKFGDLFHNNVKMLNATELNCTLKNGYDSKFHIMCFLKQFLKNSERKVTQLNHSQTVAYK